VGTIRSLSPLTTSTGCPMVDRSAGASRPQRWMALSWVKYDLIEITLSRFTVRSCNRARNSLPARRPSAVRVKNRNCFGSCKVTRARTVSR